MQVGGAAGTAKYTTPFISKVQIERGKPWLHGLALHVPSVSFVFVWSGGMDMVRTIYAGHLIHCGCNLQWIFSGATEVCTSGNKCAVATAYTKTRHKLGSRGCS